MNQSAAAAPARTDRLGRGRHISLLVLQVILGLFFVIASAVPKLTAHSSAVESFEEIGLGMWLMYAVGLLELAGGIALATPWLSGLAAVCFIGLMIGAFTVQMTVFDGKYALTPVLMTLPLALIAWGRWDTVTALPGRLRPGSRAGAAS